MFLEGRFHANGIVLHATALRRKLDGIAMRALRSRGVAYVTVRGIASRNVRANPGSE